VRCLGLKRRLTSGNGNQQKDDPQRRSERSEPVHFAGTVLELGRGRLRRQVKVRQDAAQGTQWREQIEEGPPRLLLHKGSSNQGSNNIAQTDATTDDALILATLLQRDYVRNNDHGQVGDAASANTRHPAEEVEHGRILAETTQQVRHSETRNGREIHRLAAKDVGEAAVEHLESGVGEQGRGSRPGDGVLGVEVGGDGGEGGGYAVLVDEVDEEGHGEDAEDDDEFAAGEEVGLVVEGLLGLGDGDAAGHGCC
jgi:hypothetical protein